MPQQDHTFVRDEVLPSFRVNRLLAATGSLAENFSLRRVDATTIEVPAGADDATAVITVDGKFRFRDSTVQRAHPGGVAGTYDVFVVALDDDITNIPEPNTDETDYEFDLRIVAAGGSPAIVAGSVEIHRKVGALGWDGAAITWLRQDAEAVHGAQLADDALPSTGPVVAARGPSGGFLLTVPGPLTPADGSAAAPAYSFASDPNSGVFRAGEDQLGWSLGGAEQMRLAAGQLRLPTQGSTGGLLLGGDAPLYRQAVGVLRCTTMDATSGFRVNGTALAASHLSNGVSGSGAVLLASAPSIASPALSGTPTAPTAAVDTATTQLASTAYVVNQGYLKSATAASTYAPLASPALTGVPSAPTAAVDTATTQLATTQYVVNQGYLTSSLAGSTYAPIASPTLTGVLTVPTARITTLQDAAGVTRALTSPGGSVGLLLASDAVGTIPLAVRAIASQSVNLQEWQDSGGTAQSWILSNGAAKLRQNSAIGSVAPGNYGLIVSSNNVSHPSLMVKAVSSQSADLQQWQLLSSSVPVAAVEIAGTFRQNLAAATVIQRNFLLAADANPAFRMFGDGKMEWGAGGASAPNVNLYRKSGAVATLLKTDSSLGFGVGGSLNSFTGAYAHLRSNYDDTNDNLADTARPSWTMKFDGRAGFDLFAITRAPSNGGGALGTTHVELLKMDSAGLLTTLDLKHNGSNLGFYGTTPIARPGSTNDLKASLVSLGLIVGSGATPLNLNGGVLTTAGVTNTGPFTHSGSTAGFFGVTPVSRPGSTADIKAALAGLGLLTAGGATPLDLEGGTLTAGAAYLGNATSGRLGVTWSGTTVEAQATNNAAVYVPTSLSGSTVALRFGGTERLKVDGTGIGFLGATPVGRPASYSLGSGVNYSRVLPAAPTAQNTADVLRSLLADLSPSGFGLLATTGG